MRIHIKTILGATAALLLGTLLCAGCVQGLKGLRFSHRDHASEAECTACHSGSARASHKACLACHEIDVNQPSEACLTCHTEGDYRVQARRPDGYADVTFDHDPHADVECQRCHAGAARSPRAGSQELPKMAVCTECHDGGQAPAACATCHTTLRSDVAPATHTTTWPTEHGDAARVAGASCTTCHGESGCTDCHKNERPRSHTAGWKNSGHGILADHDRTACATCHQADQCSRCHQLRPPTHYGAGFRVPADASQGHAALIQQKGGTRSCRVCHAADLCVSCHN